MSSKKFATPLQLELKGSKRLLLFLAFNHLGAIALLWLIPIPVTLQSIASAVLLFSFAYAGKRYALLNMASAVVFLRWGDGNDWTLTRFDKKELQATLRGDSYVHPLLTVLRFDTPAQRRRISVIITGDNLDRELFRQLRVRLKINKSEIVPSLNSPE